MSIYRRLETAANVSIILVALTIVWVLVAKFIVQAPSEQAVLPPGERIALSNVDWNANKRTLVLVLRKGCHLCDESAEFHRRVVRLATEQGLPVIAVLPDPMSEGKGYVEALGLDILDVRQSDMRTLRVPRVPAVILVDRRGAVQRAWVGKLQPREELEVLGTIG